MAVTTSTADISGFDPGRSAQFTDRWLAGGRWVRVVGHIAAVLALVAAAGAFLVLINPGWQVTTLVLGINAFILAVLVGCFGYELGRLILARRRGQAAARLHARIIAIFSAIAVTPAIILAVVATVTLHRGLDQWFSDLVQETVDSAQTLGQRYLYIAENAVAVDTLSMKSALENRPFGTDLTEQVFDQVSAALGWRAAAITDNEGNIVDQYVRDPSLFVPTIPIAAIASATADPNKPYVMDPGAVANRPQQVLGLFNLVTAAVTLNNAPGTILYVVRELDPETANSLMSVSHNSQSYQSLFANLANFQLRSGVIYFGLGLVVLLTAAWFALGAANRIVAPIRQLIGAADGVAKGDLNAQVSIRRSEGDVGMLGESFNRMTAQLRTQREELIGASEQIDSRRRFIEAVLSGVTAAVIGVDRSGRITVLNRTALRLLDVPPEAAVGVRADELVPELAPVMSDIEADERPEHSHQLTITRGGRARTINVKVTTEATATENRGSVITLDDITDLIAAQRNSAWADVARRIAHEIKNPLTPIQLSAERLRRKFGKVITEDRAVFDKCTETIIRQVSDIGRMVDEFSAFARMPKPALEARDLREPVRDAVFLMQVGYPDVEIGVMVSDEPLVGRFDSRMISQAITNLVKNGTEAIAALGSTSERGQIAVALYRDGDQIVLDVTDNGVGLPKADRDRLLEPYMTTREKGTGLGLAIVRKIAEEHAGKIELLDAPSVAGGGHGATVRLTFPQGGAALPILGAISRLSESTALVAAEARTEPVSE